MLKYMNMYLFLLPCQDGTPVLVYAYKNRWEQFMSIGLTKFTPFVNGSINFTNYAEVVWFFVVTETKDEFVDEVSLILDRYADRVSLLMSVKDSIGRRAIDVATPKYKQAMLERSFLFGRYEIQDGLPEHVSETCKVFLAKDHMDDGRIRNVALKFIRDRDHFEREKNVRLNCKFEAKYVILTMQLHDGDEDRKFGDEAEKKGYYRYCLVMPAAERNLGTVLMHEHIAGRDWDQLRLISKQLIEAVGHIHQQGHVHGDVKRKYLNKLS